MKKTVQITNNSKYFTNFQFTRISIHLVLFLVFSAGFTLAANAQDNPDIGDIVPPPLAQISKGETDQLNADRQTGRSGEHRQRDARSIRPGRQDIEGGIAGTRQSRRSLAESARREQQVDVFHAIGEVAPALSQHRFGLPVFFVGDIEPFSEFLARKLAQKIPVMLPLPGKGSGELEIVDAPAHGLELFERLAELDIGDLRAGLRQRARGVFEKFFRVCLRAVPEHAAAKADLELVHREGGQRLQGESRQRGAQQGEVFDRARE